VGQRPHPDPTPFGYKGGDLLGIVEHLDHLQDLQDLGVTALSLNPIFQGGDRRSVELAALLLFTFPGAPCVYYGDEIGTYTGLIALRRAHPALRT
jgi:glycosidase